MNERGEQTMTPTARREVEAQVERMQAEGGAIGKQQPSISLSTSGTAAPPRASGAISTTPTVQGDARTTPLFSVDEADGFRARWVELQTEFVDEPLRAVERADGLVAEVMQRLAQVFVAEQGTLEQQWAEGADISTEDLRVALHRYRSFFERLLAA